MEQEIKKQVGAQLAVRLDERTRYLLQLAVAATGKQVTEFVSDALVASFQSVSIYKRRDLERVYGEEAALESFDPEEERIARESLILSEKADLLWSESAIARMEVLEVIAPHLIAEKDQELLDYIRTLDDYKITIGKSWKLDRNKIDAEWESILIRFATRHVPRPKRKGGK